MKSFGRKRNGCVIIQNGSQENKVWGNLAQDKVQKQVFVDPVIDPTLQKRQGAF